VSLVEEEMKGRWREAILCIQRRLWMKCGNCEEQESGISAMSLPVQDWQNVSLVKMAFIGSGTILGNNVKIQTRLY